MDGAGVSDACKAVSTRSSNLVISYQKQKRYADALVLERVYCTFLAPVLNASHPIYLKVHGLYHEHVSDSFFNMARIHYQQGNLEEALQMHEMHHAIEIKIRGEDHENEAGSYNSMAVKYCEQGKWEEGLDLFKKALDIYRKVHGPDHPVNLGPYLLPPKP